MPAARCCGCSDDRCVRTHVRPWTASLPGRAPSQRGPARLLGFGGRAPGPPTSPPPTPLCGRRQQPGASHLPSESDTWKRRIPDCDPRPRPRPRRGLRTTSPGKLRTDHSHFLFPPPVRVPGYQRRYSQSGFSAAGSVAFYCCLRPTANSFSWSSLGFCGYYKRVRNILGTPIKVFSFC